MKPMKRSIWGLYRRFVVTLGVGCLTLLMGCGSGQQSLVVGGGDAGKQDGDAALTDTPTDGRQHDGDDDSSKPPPQHVLMHITITPLEHIEELDLNAPASIAYKAIGKFSDGVDEDMTDKVTWTIADAEIGTFEGALLNLTPMTTASARTTIITAKLDKKEARAQLTVVAYRKSGDKTDFFFTLPYNDETGEQTKPLDFKTDIRSLDVFFAMDTTGSMGGAIDNLKSSLVTGIITPMKAQIPDSHFGVGRFDDFPIRNSSASYGSGEDQPFALITPITGDQTKVVAGVNLLGLHSGADIAESLIEALYQVATGEGLTGPHPTSVAPNHTGIGGVAYREGSMPVVVPITDAPSHTVGEAGTAGYCGFDYADPVAPVAHSRQQTKDALDKICAKVVGVATTELFPSTSPPCNAEGFLTDFSTHTGARIPPSAWDTGGRPANCPAGMCCTGKNGVGRAPAPDGLCPLVFIVDSSGKGLGESVISGLKMLTRYGAFDVLTAKEGNNTSDSGDPLPEGKTTADFIRSITAIKGVKPAEPADLPEPVADGARFTSVTPGSVVTFDVIAYNDFVPAKEIAQFFSAKIKVLAGGCTDLDEREVLILVPPEPIIVIK